MSIMSKYAQTGPPMINAHLLNPSTVSMVHSLTAAPNADALLVRASLTETARNLPALALAGYQVHAEEALAVRRKGGRQEHAVQVAVHQSMDWDYRHA